MSDVVIVCEKVNNFAAQSVSGALKEAELKVECFSVKEEISDEILMDTSIVMVLGSALFSEKSFTLNKLNAKCLKLGKPVVVLGLEEENEVLRKLINRDILAKELIRPMPPGELVEEIKKLIEQESKLLERKRIMVIDDSGMVLRTIQGWLEERYEVMLSNSAMKAMAQIEEKKPDLILLDYEMPEMDGAACFEMLRMREQTCDIPVIFLTAKGDPESVKAVVSKRPEGYILKPSSKEMLLARIEEVFVKMFQ